MSVFRVHHQQAYTIISNKVIRDENLSLKTLGLFVKMLSLPPNWDFSIKGLSMICKDGEYAINHCLQELEQFHYLKRTRIYENGKIVDIEYDLYECPDDFQDTDTKNLNVENLNVENTDNKVKNNKVKTKINNIQETELSDEEFYKRYKNKKDPRTLMKWINIKITDKQVSDAMIRWLNLMIANNKWQTLEVLNTKIDMLYDSKGDLNALDVIEDTIEKGYFSFTYSINALKNSRKPLNKVPAFQYNKINADTESKPKQVELDTSEVF